MSTNSGSRSRGISREMVTFLVILELVLISILVCFLWRSNERYRGILASHKVLSIERDNWIAVAADIIVEVQRQDCVLPEIEEILERNHISKSESELLHFRVFAEERVIAIKGRED